MLLGRLFVLIENIASVKIPLARMGKGGQNTKSATFGCRSGSGHAAHTHTITVLTGKGGLRQA
jgi:hypothetical protein